MAQPLLAPKTDHAGCHDPSLSPVFRPKGLCRVSQLNSVNLQHISAETAKDLAGSRLLFAHAAVHLIQHRL